MPFSMSLDVSTLLAKGQIAFVLGRLELQFFSEAFEVVAGRMCCMLVCSQGAIPLKDRTCK